MASTPRPSTAPRWSISRSAICPESRSISMISTMANSSTTLSSTKHLRGSRRGVAGRLGGFPRGRPRGELARSRAAGRTERNCGRPAASSCFIPTAAPPDPADLPPVHMLLAVDDHVPTADIRLRVFQGGTAAPDVPTGVDAYIHRYRLFSDIPSPRETRIKLDQPAAHDRLRRMNPKAQRLAARVSATWNRPSQTRSWCWAATAPCSRRSARTGASGSRFSG